MSHKNAQTAFRPKARIMELLGEQLIKNHTLALFELVKNAYDADAEKVDLLFLNIDQPDGEIEVQDDGDGMDFDTVINIWMEPAHGHKAEKRKNGVRTEKGRLQVGEKGVGRFAVHRLGKKIEMVTRAENKPEVVVEIDWDTFAKNEYLDEARLDVFERAPKVFTGKETGTRITVSKLKHGWKRGDVRRVYRSVLGMTCASVTGSTPSEFIARFSLEPEKGWLEDFFDPALAKAQALYHLKFEINDNEFSYEYTFLPYETMKADYPKLINERDCTVSRAHSEFFTRNPPGDQKWKERKKRVKRPVLGKEEGGLGLGPIKGEILGFDLDRKIKERYLKDATGLSEFLKEQGGIRVYRDGLRVYNYGEPGDDWLELDHRRIQRPAAKLSNQLLMGEVHLSHEESINLHEKTNREGFIENDTYDELKYAILCVLSDFEVERNKDKKVIRDVMELPPGATDNSLKPQKTTEQWLDLLKQTILEKKLDSSLGKMVGEVAKTYQKTRDVLMSSAGAGLGLVTVFHELERGVRNLHASISNDTPVEKLKDQSKELVSLLQGAMYMVSRSTMEKVSASKLVTFACKSQGLRFKYHKINFVNGFESLPDLDFEIKGIRRLLTASLVNLIDNAIYWTSETDNEQRMIWVGPSHDLDGPAIVVADNGPGLIDGPEDVIQPFFTRKTDGMGIGLYFTDMTMKSHKGRLAFPEHNAVEVPKACDGAIIAMTFEKG